MRSQSRKEKDWIATVYYASGRRLKLEFLGAGFDWLRSGIPSFDDRDLRYRAASGQKKLMLSTIKKLAKTCEEVLREEQL